MGGWREPNPRRTDSKLARIGKSTLLHRFLHARQSARMPNIRSPRFKRSSKVAPIQLTKRDREIIRHIHRHRFLRSHQIVALVASSPQQVLRRLQLLYHHGYLDRPRAQLEYYERGGARPMVYGLSNKGGILLDKTLGTAPPLSKK